MDRPRKFKKSRRSPDSPAPERDIEANHLPIEQTSKSPLPNFEQAKNLLQSLNTQVASTHDVTERTPLKRSQLPPYAHRLPRKVLHGRCYRCFCGCFGCARTCCLIMTFIIIVLVMVLVVYGKVSYGQKGSGSGSLGDVLFQGAGCGSCWAIIAALKTVAAVGDEAFVNIFVDTCLRLNIAKESVCRGAIPPQATIMAQDIRQMNIWSQGTTNFCSYVFGICTAQKVMPWIVPTSLQPPTIKKRVRTGKKPFQVAHISDVHLDLTYQVGSQTRCGRPICCQDFIPDNGTITIAEPAGAYGAHSCDSPPALIDLTIKTISDFNPAFTILTGDVVDDTVWNMTESRVVWEMEHFYSRFKTPIYASLGNHDVSPVNAFPHANSHSLQSAQWVYDLASHLWGKPEMRHFSGCFARVHPGTDLKLISLNTNMWYGMNYWLFGQGDMPLDPDGILSWLVDQLADSENKGQRVWIYGHLPTGSLDALRDQSGYLNQIYQRYSDIIIGVFAGHSHQDEFQVGYSDSRNKTRETANIMGFIQGGLTPNNANPSIRLYDVDPDTYEVMDVHIYTAQITAPGFESNPEFSHYYSVKEKYGPFLNPPANKDEPLNAAFYHRITEALETNTDLFDFFYQSLRGGRNQGFINKKTRDRFICGMRAMESSQTCWIKKVGISFRKRDGSLELRPRNEQGEFNIQPEEEENEEEIMKALGWNNNGGYHHASCNSIGMKDVLQAMHSHANGEADALINMITPK